MSGGELDNKRKRQKKKHKRFMRNAKGFAKQGIYGRGTHIDDDQYSYFIGILDTIKNGFEDLEKKENMANNVFEQTKDQECHLAANQIVCKALEILIAYVEDHQLERYFEKFGNNFRPICSDHFASHVLQKMVEIAFLRGLSTETVIKTENNETVAKRIKTDTILSETEYSCQKNFSETHRAACRQFVLRTSKFLLNNLEDFVWDRCANHIMRTCILSLAGVHMPKVSFGKHNVGAIKTFKQYKVPEEWIEIMKEFPQRLEMWPQFVEFPYEEHSSALLGCICVALHAVDKSMLRKFGKKILMKAFLKTEQDTDDNEDKKSNKINLTQDCDGTDEGKQLKEHDNKLPRVFLYQSSIILLETLLEIASKKLLVQLNVLLFTGHIEQLAKQQMTNFAVQKLLEHVKEKTEFENIFAILQEHIEELLKIGHTGVVLALATACLRLSTKQAQFIGALQNALHIAGDKEKLKYFFKCLIKLKPYEIILEDKTTFVHLHGSLIIQQILQYNKPIFLVNCILETKAEELAAIVNTPNGSHIVDAFMQSKFIGQKSSEKFIRKLEGFYVDLAITRQGSRVVDECFAAAHEAQKAHIVRELADKLNMLKGTIYGRLVCSKLRVETYKLSATQWKAGMHQKVDKVQQLFQDIIN